MNTAVNMGLNLKVRDVSGQRPFSVKNFRRDAAVGELVHGLVNRMDLDTHDPNGRSHAYHAFLEREGRHLHASELVGEVLREGDEIILQPDIQAGGL